MPSAISAKRAIPDKAFVVPIVLFGTEYWRGIIDFVHCTDSVDDVHEWIVRQLAEKALGQPERRYKEGASGGGTVE